MSRGPLADRMRPETLDEVLGQGRWLAEGAPLRRAADEKRITSMILWGPPGCGKTTIARILSRDAGYRMLQLSAVLDGVKALRPIVDELKAPRLDPRPILLFVDEIHRWNKAQQDALLPHVESGGIVLIGATTENPSFQVNSALRSRLRIVRLEPLTTDDIEALLEQALRGERGLARPELEVEAGLLRAIAEAAAGDARRALGDLDQIVAALRGDDPLTAAHVATTLQRSDIRHDRTGEDHFNVVSALIKSLRGSDPDAALYWLARMIAAGEDPRFITRRLIVFASEDVGNADPRALSVATDAHQALQFIGMPEGRIVLAQAVTWLATCPKSNAAYTAIAAALADVERYGALPVPLHLRQAATRHMKEEGYGAGYLYPHDHPHKIVKQTYRPPQLEARVYYEPTGHGDEKVIVQRMEWWRRKLGED